MSSGLLSFGLNTYANVRPSDRPFLTLPTHHQPSMPIIVKCLGMALSQGEPLRLGGSRRALSPQGGVPGPQLSGADVLTARVLRFWGVVRVLLLCVALRV
jgi:hypothetical protein